MFPLRDINPSRIFPWVVVGLILINTVVFIFETTLYEPRMFFREFGFVPGMADTHYWSYMTALFIHGDVGHLISNMWFLWLFGDNVEDQMGHGRFLVFFLLCGVLASGIHFLTEPNSMIPVVGASGAIAGVMGAYLRLFKKARILTYMPPLFLFRIPAWIYLALWLAFQIVSGLNTLSISGNEVAVWAHVGGFLSGIIFYRIFIREDEDNFVEKRYE
jgi:membrane associated rhomboid family serine protease